MKSILTASAVLVLFSATTVYAASPDTVVKAAKSCCELLACCGLFCCG